MQLRRRIKAWPGDLGPVRFRPRHEVSVRLTNQERDTMKHLDLKHYPIRHENHNARALHPTSRLVTTEGFILANEVLSADFGYLAAQCVNACEGINPEAVPDLLEALERIGSNELPPHHIKDPLKNGAGSGISLSLCYSQIAEFHREIAKAAIAKATP